MVFPGARRKVGGRRWGRGKEGGRSGKQAVVSSSVVGGQRPEERVKGWAALLSGVLCWFLTPWVSGFNGSGLRPITVPDLSLTTRKSPEIGLKMNKSTAGWDGMVLHPRVIPLHERLGRGAELSLN